ncbi:MAG: 50S ribosomal protein L23 [Candidatus Diapherotrites archaeon]|nr:50S ribosomal protein L23 [Candidatus Diapherotrites archaeon]
MAEKKTKPKPVKETKAKAVPVAAVVKATPEEQNWAYKVLVHPLISEKAVGFIESENKISFIVGREATKPQIKKAVEKLFEVKVASVNVLNDTSARKRAFVKLAKGFKAENLATKLGVM